MTDPHQVNAIIATAIMNSEVDADHDAVDVEKAKHIAKCIVMALTDAGLEITPKNNAADSVDD